MQFGVPMQHQSTVSTVNDNNQPSINNDVSDKDIIAALMSEIQGLRAQLSSIINQHQAQLEAQQKQHEFTLSLIQAAFPNNEALAAIFVGNNNDISLHSDMEVDNDSKNSTTKRRRSIENGGSGDERQCIKKVLVNTAAGTIVDGRFIHGKRVAQASPTVSQSTPNAPVTDVGSNHPNILDKANANEQGSSTDTPETEPSEDKNLSDNSGNANFQIVTRRKKAAAKEKPAVKETVSIKATKTTKETATNNSTLPNKIEVPTESTPTPKVFKKPPPITVTAPCAEILKCLAKWEGDFTVKTRKTNSRCETIVQANTYDVHPLFCEQFAIANLEFHTHDLQPYKIFRVVLKGVDALPNEVITEMIHKAVGSAPTRIATINNKTTMFHIVSFKASEVDMSVLEKVRTMGMYGAKWETYKPKRTGPTQCTTCLAFGHGQQNCSRTPKCLFCADDHNFALCKLTDMEEKVAMELLRCHNCIQ